MENKRLFFAQKCGFSSIMGNYKQKKRDKANTGNYTPRKSSPAV